MKKVTTALFLLISIQCFSQIEITLRKTFIDSIKNRLSIDANFFVVAALPHPHAAAADADLHVGGYDNAIGLATVAEIMNAKEETSALNTIHSNEGGNNPIHINGVWRFWCEHPGSEGAFKQGDKNALQAINNSNPDHVFEIHPLLSIGSDNLLTSLKKINGFRYKDAETAFNAYSNLGCKITDKNDGMITIETNGIGYNYVDFSIRIADATQFVVDDGRFVMCEVLDKNGDVLVQKMRMAFPLNSTAEKKVRNKKTGDIMHVAGLPRIDMALIDYRTKHTADFADILNWNLPVEMVIVSDLSQTQRSPTSRPTAVQ